MTTGLSRGRSEATLEAFAAGSRWQGQEKQWADSCPRC